MSRNTSSETTALNLKEILVRPAQRFEEQRYQALMQANAQALLSRSILDQPYRIGAPKIMLTAEVGYEPVTARKTFLAYDASPSV